MKGFVSEIENNFLSTLNYGQLILGVETSITKLKRRNARTSSNLSWRHSKRCSQNFYFWLSLKQSWECVKMFKCQCEDTWVDLMEDNVNGINLLTPKYSFSNLGFEDFREVLTKGFMPGSVIVLVWAIQSTLKVTSTYFRPQFISFISYVHSLIRPSVCL